MSIATNSREQFERRPARDLWAGTDRLLEGATLHGILSHRLGPLAANRLRRLGTSVPEALFQEERAASLSMLTAVPLLERIRASCDGPLVLVKGPEIARLYPGSARRFADVDLLTRDALAVQRALLNEGFQQYDDPDWEHVAGHHHLKPLKWPTIWLKVEVHSLPNWPAHAGKPRVDEIVEAASPSGLAIDGLSAPDALHHALILAAHAWRHEPLQTLSDLIDVAAVTAAADSRELEHTAAAWGLGRVWQTTARAIDSVFYEDRPTLPLRTWARHLREVRERSVAEDHLARVVHPFWGMSPRHALRAAPLAVADTLRPVPGETWSDKVKRVRRAVREPQAPIERRTGPRRPRDHNDSEKAPPA